MTRRLATATAVASVLCLSGCLGDSGGGGTDTGTGADSGAGGARLTAAQVLQQVSQKTRQVNTYRSRAVMNGKLYGTFPLRMKISGKYRLRPQLAWSSVVTGGATGGQARAGDIQSVLLNDTVYVKLGGLGQATTGRPWVKYPVSQLYGKSGGQVKSGGQGTSALGETQQFDPVTQTKLFLASEDARQAGSETVGGVRTTHYAGTYSIKAARSYLDAHDQQSLQRLGVSDKWHFDVWVDGERLPRKMTVKTAPGSKSTLVATALFYDYNKPVTVSAPPPGQVGELPNTGG